MSQTKETLGTADVKLFEYGPKTVLDFFRFVIFFGFPMLSIFLALCNILNLAFKLPFASF